MRGARARGWDGLGGLCSRGVTVEQSNRQDGGAEHIRMREFVAMLPS